MRRSPKYTLLFSLLVICGMAMGHLPPKPYCTGLCHDAYINYISETSCPSTSNIITCGFGNCSKVTEVVDGGCDPTNEEPTSYACHPTSFADFIVYNLPSTFCQYDFEISNCFCPEPVVGEFLHQFAKSCGSYPCNINSPDSDDLEAPPPAPRPKP